MHDKAGRTHRYTAHHHTHYYIRSKPEIMPTTSFSHFSYFTWCICCHHPFARVPGLEFRPGGTVLKFVCNKNWNLPWIGIYISINAIKVIVFFATFCCHHPFCPAKPTTSRSEGPVEHLRMVAIRPNQDVAKNLWKYSYFTWCLSFLTALCCHHTFCLASQRSESPAEHLGMVEIRPNQYVIIKKRFRNNCNSKIVILFYIWWCVKSQSSWFVHT